MSFRRKKNIMIKEEEVKRKMKREKRAKRQGKEVLGRTNTVLSFDTAGIA